MGQLAGQGGEGADQGGQVLAGLDRAQPEHIRAVQAQAAAEVGDPLGGRRLQVGAERGHVDPVGGELEPLGQVGGGGRGHAQHPGAAATARRRPSRSSGPCWPRAIRGG